MNFDHYRDFRENGEIKGDLVTRVRHSALVAIGEDLPAEHVQYLRLVIGGYHRPGGLQHKIG